MSTVATWSQIDYSRTIGWSGGRAKQLQLHRQVGSSQRRVGSQLMAVRLGVKVGSQSQPDCTPMGLRRGRTIAENIRNLSVADPIQLGAKDLWPQPYCAKAVWAGADWPFAVLNWTELSGRFCSTEEQISNDNNSNSNWLSSTVVITTDVT